RQTENGGIFSLAYIDIDKLKELNDASGTHLGDEAIKLVANVLREHIRSFDTASRLGGDEFAILMPNTKTADCKSLCEELSVRISKHMKKAAFPITASIGHVTFEQAPVSISDVFHQAETAMLEVQANNQAH
ncbi:MAG: GGDEF domain-containing protein, partial [Gallionellaceae bacterium]